MNLGKFKTAAIQQMLASPEIIKEGTLGRTNFKRTVQMGEEEKQEMKERLK